MENLAVINLKRLKQNAINVKRKLKKSVKFCAVVKANAYGHGDCEVASALYPLVDCFAVATVLEGVRLRLSGIDKEILVLSSTVRKDAKISVEHNLTLSLQSLSDLKYLNGVAKKMGERAKVHLKYNTGMNRLGIDNICQLQEILDYAKTHKNVVISGLYSHFASPENTRVRKAQMQEFLPAVRLCKSFDQNIITHISASGGFICGEQMDMVRIGILLYGYTPFKTDYLKVMPVMKVYSPILRKRNNLKGKLCLYGHTKVKDNGGVYLVRYGYADGLCRNKVKGLLNNRCMDISAVRKKNAYEKVKGDMLCILDDARVLAKEYKTITYEILTKCSFRTEKIYIK